MRTAACCGTVPERRTELRRPTQPSARAHRAGHRSGTGPDLRVGLHGGRPMIERSPAHFFDRSSDDIDRTGDGCGERPHSGPGRGHATSSAGDMVTRSSTSGSARLRRMSSCPGCFPARQFVNFTDHGKSRTSSELRIDIDRLIDRSRLAGRAIEEHGCPAALTDEDRAGRDLVVSGCVTRARDHDRRDPQRPGDGGKRWPAADDYTIGGPHRQPL